MHQFALLWNGIRLQAKFTLVVAIGVLALAAATVMVVAHFESSSLEQRVRALSERELTSLNSLVDSSMKMRLNDPQNIAIGVFEGWFESRNKEYAGKLWSVWGPGTAAYMARTAPATRPKAALDAIDEEVLRTGQPVGRFVGDTYRYSMPIVQDEAVVTKQEVCIACHVHAMGAKSGEVLTVFSTSVPVTADLADLRQRIQLIIGGALAAIVVMMLALFSTFGRIVARPIRAIAAVLTELTNDRIVDVPYTNRRDEVGDIAKATEVFKRMAARIGSTIAEIKAVAHEVSSASVEISSSTSDLSQRTEEQAASLEETSASMEEIAVTVGKNAENAQQANQFASETHAVAKRGGAVVGDAVRAMARIEESSRKISDIIGVIDEIARQTNLLALNAAVEAARAGEAGRGFAVVAIEVRSLAQRSSQAAKDIKDLINSSSGQVKEGVELVNRTGVSLEEIVASTKKVTDIVSDIAHASIEQSTGIEQVKKTLSQMDEITQQNSALVEENAATARTLEHQAKAMDERMSVFRLGEAAAEAGASPAYRSAGAGQAPVAGARPRRAA